MARGGRKTVECDSEGKPMWKPSQKANSPSTRTYGEGGSLRTHRRRFVKKEKSNYIRYNIVYHFSDLEVNPRQEGIHVYYTIHP